MIYTIPKDDALEKQMKAQIKKLSQELTDAKKAASAAAAEQQALEMEIGRCLLGQSRFSEETLSNLITEKAAERKRKHDDKVKADADRRAKRAAEKAARDAEKA